MKPKAIVVASALFLFAMQWAFAQSLNRGSQGSSQGSAAISAGSGEVIAGSLDIFAASGELVVIGLEKIGESTVILLKGASEAATASVKVSAEIAAAASFTVGSAVQVVTASTGYTLMTAGRVLAFIPNEVGRSLLYHQRIEERR